MFKSVFEVLFLIGLVAMEVVRYPHRMRNKKARRAREITASHVSAGQFTLDMLAFAGTEVLPLVYIFSSWLDFADYRRRPTWLGWLGIPLLAGGLWLLRRAHLDLGRNWSPTVEITKGQQLVTHGVYGAIRHPIYAAVWLFTIAQALMLPNWIAGLAGLASAGLLFLVRVPEEEKMMLDQFGGEYRAYMARTGRVIPRTGA